MPLLNPLFGSGYDPETRFDHWLDGFVTGTPVADASRIDDPTGQFARAQSGARQLHDLATQPVTMPGILPARQRIEECMMYSGTLAAPGTGNIGTSWKSPRRHRDDKGAWWSLKSPVIAAALIVAVLVSLSGALYWVQRPETSPAPTESPGFAQSSPGTTPEGGSLSCGAPGYRPVVWDGVDPNTLIAIGEAQEPIVRDGTILSIPIADTGEIVSIEDTYLTWGWDDGVVFATESDDDETILATSLTTGRQWMFPVIDSMGTASHSVTVVGNYLIGAERSDGTNYRVIDLATGEERTIADIGGEGFDHLMTPYVDSHNSTVAGSGSAALLFRSFSPSDFEILFLPNDLSDARLVSNTDGMHFIEPSSVTVREHHVAFLGIDEDGNVVLRIEDGATGELVLDRVLPTDSTKISAADVRLLSDGVIIVNERHVLRVPLDTNQEVELIYESNGDTAIKNPEFAPDGSAVIIALQPPDATPSIRRASIWLDTTTGETIDITTEGYRVSRGDWSAISNETGASLIDLSTGEVIAQVAGDYRHGVHLDERGIAIATAADNSHVAVLSGSTRQVFLINAPSTQSEINLYPQLLDISPSGSCLLLNDTEHGNSYIAPLEPDGEWTQLDVQLTDWWEVPTGTVQTLPAQDFASPVASPGTPTVSSDLLIIDSDATGDFLKHYDYVGTIDDDVFTVKQPNGKRVTYPDVVSVESNHVPGQAIVLRKDASRSVVSLITGATLFDLPDKAEHESRAGFYLFVSESGDNADWTMIDLRSGESRPLADIFTLPSDPPLLPVQSGPLVDGVSTVFMHFIAPDFGEAAASDIPSFLIAGSLDNTTVLEGYPPATQVVSQQPVVSPNEEVVAWIAITPERAIVIADTGTGDELARFDPAALGSSPELGGFLEGSQNLVVTTRERVLLLSWTNGEPQLVIVAEGLDGTSNPILYAPSSSLYFREDGALKRMLISSGDTITILDNLSGEPVRFTGPDSSWLIANPGGDAALIDARSGEVVSQLTDVPKNTSTYGAYSISTSLDGSTVIQIPGGLHTEYHAWVMSPRFPDGLVLTAPIEPGEVDPDRVIPVGFALSPDARSILVGTNGDVGFTPRYIATLKPDLDWVELAHNVGSAQWIPMPGLAPDDQAIVTSPADSALSQLIPNNLVPVFGPGPIDELPDSQNGGFSEAGLIIPLRNGETYHAPAGVGISQILHSGIAIVEHADGSRISIDFNTGETLTSLYPDSPNEQLFGVFQLTPVDGDMSNWRILDMRSGKEVTTTELLGTQFDSAAIPVMIAFDLEQPATMLIRFVVPVSSAGELEPVSTASGESSSVIIPGTLDAARVTDLNYGQTFGDPQPIALQTLGSATLFAYVTDMPSEVIHVDNATSGENIQTFTANEISAEGQVFIAGFIDHGNALVVWSGSTVSMLDIADGTAAAFTVGAGTIEQVLPGASSALVMTNLSAGTPTATGESAWHHLNVATGEWTDLPELDGYHLDRTLPASQWVVLRSGGGPTDTSIVIVDKRTGEIAALLDNADLGTATALSPAHDFSTIVITGHTGDEASTGYVLDAEHGDAWELTPPNFDLSQSANIIYRVSPDGSVLVATDFNSPTASEADPGETWISPVQPEPEWTSIGNRAIETWLYDPNGNP